MVYTWYTASLRLIDRSKILVQLHFKDLDDSQMDNFVTKPKLMPFLP